MIFFTSNCEQDWTLSALVAAVSLAAIAFATGCNPAGVTDNTDQSKASSILNGSNIKLEGSNLGEYLGRLVNHDPDTIIAGDATVPYLPVLTSNLVNGTLPYLTFTFDKPVTQVFGSTRVTPGYKAQSQYVFDLTSGTATPMLLSGLPTISGNTVTLYVSPITQSTGTDNHTFIIDNKYLVDFFVRTNDGDYGRITIAFTPTEADLTLGAFGDSNISIYGKTTEGSAVYSLYKIDSSCVYYLNRGASATHIASAKNDEKVYFLAKEYTTFDTWESRYYNGQGTSGINSEYYDSLDAVATKGKILNYVQLRWTPVANATAYLIQTTSDEGSNPHWNDVGNVDAYATDTVCTFPFYINGAYPIGKYRAVRIVPINTVMVGTPGIIRLVDEVSPLTDAIDEASKLNSFRGVASFTDHTQTCALNEGEIVATGTKDLSLDQPTSIDESYIISNITGSLNLEVHALNGLEMPITIDEVKKAITYDASDRFFLLGDAVGVLNTSNILRVYVHLKCHMATTGTITYTDSDTTITGNLNVTYTDLYGNPMISRSSTANSKNSGVVIFSEI